MRKRKQTFTDPQTGQKIKSTWQARRVSWLAWGLLIGLCGGLLIGWFAEQSLELAGGLGLGLFGGLGVGIVGGMVGTSMKATRRNDFIRRVHDEIALAQHRRRQRVPPPNQTNEEWAHVPNTAISRAQPPGEPQPTDAALSIADDHDEPSRLVSSTENTIEAVVDDSA